MTSSEKQVFKKPGCQYQTPFQAQKPAKRRLKTPHPSKVQLSQVSLSKNETEKYLQNADSGENSPEIVKTKKPRWRYLQTNDPKRYGKYKLLLNFGKYADNDSPDSGL